MRVKFVLTMKDLVIEGQMRKKVVIAWEDDLDSQEITELSHKWVSSRNFLTNRMTGLDRVGESVLTIEPLEDNK